MNTYKVGRYQTQWNKSKAGKMTYVDKIFFDSKKPERTAPAPNTYSPDRIPHMVPKSVGQVWGRDKRISDIDRIFINEKKRVAPNAYKNIDEAYKQKVYGITLGQIKDHKNGLVGELEYLSQQSPCSNFYNLDPTALSKNTRIPIANMKRDMVIRSPPPKPEVSKSPSPHSYPDKDHSWTQLSHQ